MRRSSILGLMAVVAILAADFTVARVFYLERKAMFPGAVNYGPFLNIGHCLFALLLGLVGAVIARWFEKRSERRMEHAV
jgi:hypothetical protein